MVITCTVAGDTTADHITDAGDGDMSSYLLSAFVNRERDRWTSQWNDHEWLYAHRDDPILGGLYKRRYQELYDAERKREKDDFNRITGASGSQYWTHDYQYNSGYYSPSGYLFEVSEAIMALYGMNRSL